MSEPGPRTLPRLVEVPPPAEEDRDPRLGRVLHDTYRVMRRIAEGGMGSVYEVQHLRLQQRFAMKVMEHQAARNDEAYARFRQEAEIAASLNHASIVAVFDFNNDEFGNPYMVMELVEGTTLNRFIAGRQLALRDVLRIIEPLSSALDAAHRAGIVHRDLKPSNVMIRRSANGSYEVKLLDFGISKMRDTDASMTCENVVMGTPNYMSPEQARGRASTVDAKTDIFALGAILYEMLSGKRAFEGSDTPELLHRIVYDDPAPLAGHRGDLPPALVAVVERCLAKNPEQRFASIRDFMLAVREVLRPSQRKPTPEVPLVLDLPAKSSVRPLLWAIGWAASVAVAAIVAATFVSRQSHEILEPRGRVSHRSPVVASIPTVASDPLPTFDPDLATAGARMMNYGMALYRADSRGLTFWADPDATPKVATLPSAQATTALNLSAEGEILVGQADGTVSGWPHELDGASWHHRVLDTPIDAIAAGSDYLAVGSGTDVHLFNHNTGRALKAFAGQEPVAGLLVSRTPRRLLLVFRPSKVEIIDTDKRRTIEEIDAPGVPLAARLVAEPTQIDLEIALDFAQGDWIVRRHFQLIESRRNHFELRELEAERI